MTKDDDMRNYQQNLDHVVVVVANLTVAMEQYRSLGFTVSFGGDNGPTHNALIPFEDGTYIELISMRSRLMKVIFSLLYRSKLHYCFKPFASDLSFRFFCWMGGKTGIRDWCSRRKALDRFVRALNAHNISATKVEKFTRIKPNLESAQWLLAAPQDQRLPFFIQDITRIEIRIPNGDAARHSNGYLGISGILLNHRVYSPAMDQLVTLESHNDFSEASSSKKKIQLVDGKQNQISVELIGAQSTIGVLEMRNNQLPTIERRVNIESDY